MCKGFFVTKLKRSEGKWREEISLTKVTDKLGVVELGMEKCRWKS